MKLLRDRLYAPLLPPRLLRELGLAPSKYGSWRLTPAQRDRILEELGAAPAPKRSTPKAVLREPMYPHQQDGLDFARAHNWRAGLFYDMGLGKTRLSIEILRESETITEAIILAPRAVIHQWADQFMHWASVQATVVYGDLDRRLELIERPGPWILNYDGLIIRRCGKCGAHKCSCPGRKTYDYPVIDALLSRGPKALVMDESTRIKDWTTRTAKITHRLVEHIPGPILPMSGKPNPNQPYDFWSQLRTIQRVPLGFSTPYTMRERYCVMGGPTGKWVKGHKNLDELHEKLATCSIRKTIDECLDLPERIVTQVPVELDKREMRAYRAMVKDSVASLSRTKTLTAENVLSKILRLQQLTGGMAAKGRNGAKVEAILDLVEDAPRPLIIWCRFTEEIEHLAKVLGKAYKVRTFYGETPQRERKQTLEAFDNGAVDVLIGQPRAGGIGLNLQASCYMIFYSHSFSLEEREQAMARIYRAGQKRITRIMDLVAKDTVDEHVLKALETKGNVSTAALDGWKEWMR